MLEQRPKNDGFVHRPEVRRTLLQPSFSRARAVNAPRPRRSRERLGARGTPRAQRSGRRAPEVFGVGRDQMEMDAEMTRNLFLESPS